MAVQVQLCFLLFGTCLFSFLLLLECRKLEGYDFPVFSTKKCPENQVKWKKRSSAINCTEQNGYMCLPNENLTDLLEFCYIYPRILVQQDLCLYLDKRFSKVNSYNCRRFSHGCPELHYFSSDTYLHQSCMEIENGCFSAEPSCKRHPLRSEPSTDVTTVAISLGVSIPICLLSILAFYVIIRKKYRKSEERRRIERIFEEIEEMNLFSRDEPRHYKEFPNEKAMFDQWKQDDSCFITTNACEEVEKLIKSRNLVIVAGHSGSGKSAIIQHIALKYREQGWTVKRVTNVKDIKKHSYGERAFFVFDDPFGKESCNEVMIASWKMCKVKLKIDISKSKLLMSCRNNIMSDTRIAHYLMNQSDIVDIDSEKYKLSVDEKRHILTRYSSDMNLSDNECDKIVEAERYFPLLCKLYSSKKYKKKDIVFFTKPETALKDVILEFQKKDKGKYCALALLVLFNSDLCPNDLFENEDTKDKFKHTLKMCGLPGNMPSSAIVDKLNSLKDFLVIKVGDKYQYRFCHDFVMEVTTHVFRKKYPDETIEYADIGLLEKVVRLWGFEENNDPFNFYLSDNYIEKLGERFLNELIGNRFMDVVLNPCMKEKRMIEALKKIIQKNPEKLQLLLKNKKHRLQLPDSSIFILEHLYLSKLVCIGLEKNISPLFALIALGHTDFSSECLITLQQFKANSIDRSLLPAVYCNGSISLFDIFPKNVAIVNKSSTNMCENYEYIRPIHIVSVYHNYEILTKLIQDGAETNSKCSTWEIWTPLLLAVGNDTQRYRDYDHEESGAIRRDETVQLLLSNGADINISNREGSNALHIACKMGYTSTVKLLLRNGANINLCGKDGASPLYIACQNGHDSTAQFLLSNGADIRLCEEDGTSPLHIACSEGNHSTVQLLLNNGADVNLPTEDGASPLYKACQNGHDSIVELLLSNGVDINLCTKNGNSPLYNACQNGHDSTAQLLLSNGADIRLCEKDGASPLHIACLEGNHSTVQLLLNNGADINLPMGDGASPLYKACQNGHDSIVELLLSNGADINLCTRDGTSPLYNACQNGHDSTAQLLISNGADICLCEKDGAGPLHIACLKGNHSTVQLLLNNGADVNLPMEDGASPLYKACQNGHDSIVELLLSNGADINLCTKDGTSPLYNACQNGHDSTAQLLLSNGADIRLCEKDGASPLHIACLKRNHNTVQLLLNNGADVNLPTEDGASPLYKACQNGHDSIVELLLSNGADINLCTKDGTSPLYIACQNGHESIVQLLQSIGADISLYTKNGTSCKQMTIR